MNREPQHFRIAERTSSASPTLRYVSWRPAKDAPSRSSAVAEERTAEKWTSCSREYSGERRQDRFPKLRREFGRLEGVADPPGDRIDALGPLEVERRHGTGDLLFEDRGVDERLVGLRRDDEPRRHRQALPDQLAQLAGLSPDQREVRVGDVREVHDLRHGSSVLRGGRCRPRGQKTGSTGGRSRGLGPEMSGPREHRGQGVGSTRSSVPFGHFVVVELPSGGHRRCHLGNVLNPSVGKVDQNAICDAGRR